MLIKDGYINLVSRFGIPKALIYFKIIFFEDSDLIIKLFSLNPFKFFKYLAILLLKPVLISFYGEKIYFISSA